MQTRTKVALFFAFALCAARVAHAAEAVCSQALAKPTDVKGKALSSSELRFTWHMPAGAEACIDTFTYYVVEAGAADQSAASAVSQRGAMKCSGGGGGKKFTYIATNLKSDTAYRFYVRSVNEAKAATSALVAAVATTAEERD